jgi:hypothetical protein
MATPPTDYGQAIGKTTTVNATGDTQANVKNISNFVPDGPVAVGDVIMGEMIPWNTSIVFLGPGSILVSNPPEGDMQGARFAVVHKILTPDQQTS